MNLRLCRDCRWAERSFFSRVGRFAKCLNPAAKRPNSDHDVEVLVRGRSSEPTHTQGYCVTMRRFPDECGHDGSWWEPRQPWLIIAALRAARVVLEDAVRKDYPKR